MWPTKTREHLLDLVQACLQSAAGSHFHLNFDERTQLRHLTLKNNYNRRMLISTDYSGIDTPKWCFHAVGPLMADAFRTLSGGCTFTRSCDFGDIQSQVLQSIGRTDDSCHFGNMLHRLPKTAQEFIQSALLERGATVDERSQARRWIQGWLFANRQWIVESSAKSWCYVHARYCPIIGERGPTRGNRTR